MAAWSEIAEQVHLIRTFKEPFVSFLAILVLLATPTSVSLTSGGYVPSVSFFVDGIKADLLPAGWSMIVTSPTEILEIYVTASVTLALLLSSPVISYQVMKLIVPAGTRERVLYSLVASASVLLAVGAVFGFSFLFRDYLSATTSFYALVGSPPVVDAAGFYFLVFRFIGIGAVSFTLPIYVYALVRFRRK